MDTILRELLANEPDPIEKLAADQHRAVSEWVVRITSAADHFLKTGQRIAVLECGHFVLTRALRSAKCRRCGEMIRSGYDHDGFRRLGMPDEFSWPEDPLAILNEGQRAADGEDVGNTITRRQVC
jgi:hypothetical protein